MPHFLFCIFSDLSMATNLKKCGFVDIKPMLAVEGGLCVYQTDRSTGTLTIKYKDVQDVRNMWSHYADTP